MSAALIQRVDSGVGVTGTQNVTVAALTPGSTVIVSCYEVTGSPDGWTVSDVNNGSYPLINSGASGTLTAQINAKRNILGGATTITITPAVTVGIFYYAIYEVSGLSNSATIQTDENIDGGSSTSHNLGAVGVTGTGFGCGAAYFTLGSTPSAAGSWTKDPTDSGGGITQYKIGTFSTDKGPFTTAPADIALSIMAFIPEVSAPVGVPFFTQISAKRI